MTRIYGTPFAMIPEWVIDSPVLSDRAVRVFAMLGRYTNDSGRAFPGRPKLAERLRCSTDSIDRAIAELVAAEALAVVPRYREDGSRTSNDYWLWPATPGGVIPSPLVAGAAPPSAPVRLGSRQPAEAKNESQVTRARGETTSLDLAEFDDFWSTYPRREGRRAAEAAYAKARLVASAVDLLLGAIRYRDDPNRDPAYTKHPTTWLNQGCWSDEPLPVRRAAEQRPMRQGPGLTEAWTEVQRAVRSRGFSQGPPDWSHPELARTVEAVSWRRLCHDTNDSALYAQFRDTYRGQFEEAAR